jgi:dolichol-phosphate mannosyltransferase
LKASRSQKVALTVLVPCFNEGSILAQTAANLRGYLEGGDWRCGLTGGWEVLFIDDGSTDNSREVLDILVSSDPRFRYITYRINRGQGRALQTGFSGAMGEWIFCVDADLDYGPEHIESFLSVALREGADIVVGSAYMPGGSATGVPKTRYWMSRAMNWYFAKVLNLGFYTYTSIVRLYRRSTIHSMLLTTADKDLLPEILIKATLLGIPMVEIPAHLKWGSRTEGRTGAGIRTIARKALRHLLWGALENPLLFFAVPAAVVGVGTLWFGGAIAILFSRAYTSTNLSGLARISSAASEVALANPQTIAIFTILAQAGLLLFTISLVILQNKTKRDHDFIYFSRLMSKIEEKDRRVE